MSVNGRQVGRGQRKPIEDCDYIVLGIQNNNSLAYIYKKVQRTVWKDYIELKLLGVYIFVLFEITKY